MMGARIKILFIMLCFGLSVCIASGTENAAQQPAEPEDNATEVMEDDAQTIIEEMVQEPNLPEDLSARLEVREIRISGNNLIPTEDLFETVPQIFNASDKPLLKAESQNLYDLSPVLEVLAIPGRPREVSMRTIQGLTQHILSVYSKNHYGGIYVYVPQGVIDPNNELQDGILMIKVLEAPVSEIDIKYNGIEDTGYLKNSAIMEWSPLKTDKMINQKELDNFVNLLNLNPDRHVSVLFSQATEPNTLKAQYDIYEADPWHYFIQVDNSGTNDRQWSPRFGIINTNLLGFDDKFTVVYQAKPDSTITENYSIYGSYDFPIMGPRLRLNLYGGHSEFDINPESGTFNFLGRGTFYGAGLRYNVLQHKSWFFDVTGSFSHERSKVTPSLFPTAGSDVEMYLYGVGAELHRSNDISNSSVSVNMVQSLSGSSRDRFQLARTQADPDFTIYTFAANHGQYLDLQKIHQAKGVFRWITSDERLIPAKMTSFGGMYSVRGYDEYEIVADGGILGSIQYEFDWLRYEQFKEDDQVDTETDEEEAVAQESLLTKLSPVVFTDYGRSKIKDPVIGENDNQTLWSVGVGTLIELGENLSGACYYGYPMKKTDDTRVGKGRLSVSFMLRW